MIATSINRSFLLPSSAVWDASRALEKVRSTGNVRWANEHAHAIANLISMEADDANWDGLEKPIPLHPARADFLICDVFESEVSNGGIDQAVYNSSGIFFWDLPAAYERFGADSFKSVCTEVIDYLANNGIRRWDRPTFVEILDDSQVEQRFDDFTDKFHSDTGEVSSPERMAYAIEHRDLFFQPE